MQLLTTPTASPFAAMQPLDSGSTAAPNAPSSSSDSGSTSITANDFLQLLVTEMKNQDPTANTDPNEYIDQLVQVNSLEQLVQINQDLGGSASSTSGSSDTRSSGTGNSSGAIAGSSQVHSSSAAVPQKNAAGNFASGNLSATDTGNSGSHLANALETATRFLAPGSSSSPINSVLSSARAHAQHVRAPLSNPAH